MNQPCVVDYSATSVCMYVCVCVCVRVDVYEYLSVCLHIYIYVYVHTHIYIYNMHIHVHTYRVMRVCIPIHSHAHVCSYTLMWISIMSMFAYMHRSDATCEILHVPTVYDQILELGYRIR